MIEVEKITKRFGVVTAIENVSFKIKKGEVVGFLGPNGAGKTTTMRILTCYIPADEGEAKIDGCDVLEQSMEVRKKIGYLPENAPLYHDMRVDVFLEYVASIRGLAGAAKKKALDDIIGVCGLADALKKQIGELSKGYRQRVGLAQAMIHNPQILILDEPTSGLDPNQISEIRGLIKELGKEKTVILSTHILPEVEATCGRVIIINRGRIVADGSVDQIAASAGQGPRYEVLFRGERDKIEAGLKAIGSVKSFDFGGKEDGMMRFLVEPREGARPGSEIFRMAADSGLTIAELALKKPSLESAFHELTVGKLAQAAFDEADCNEDETDDGDKDDEKEK